MQIKRLLNTNINELKKKVELLKQQAHVPGYWGYAEVELAPLMEDLSPRIQKLLLRNGILKVWDLAKFSRHDFKNIINETFISDRPTDEECFFITETLDLILGMLELSFVPAEPSLYTTDKEWNSLEILLLKHKPKTTGLEGGER